MDFIDQDLYDNFIFIKKMEHYIESITYIMALNFFAFLILFVYILIVKKDMKYKYKKLKYKIRHISIV